MSGWQFPQWSYGYTQMPGGYPYPGPGGAGGYPGYHPPPPPRPPLPHTAGRGRGGKAPAAPQTFSPPSTSTTSTTSPGTVVIKAEPVIQSQTTVAGTSIAVKTEEGEIVEKSVHGILNGRNAVMFCNGKKYCRQFLTSEITAFYTRPEQTPRSSHGVGTGEMRRDVWRMFYCCNVLL